MFDEDALGNVMCMTSHDLILFEYGYVLIRYKFKTYHEPTWHRYPPGDIKGYIGYKGRFPLHHALYIYHFQDIITFSGLAIGIRIRITIFYRP